MAEEENERPQLTGKPGSWTACSRFTGRKKITVGYDRVDEENIEDVMSKTLPDHYANKADAEYLWKYFRGVQPVLGREKASRPEICNNIVENHAQEVVNFKVGYQFAEPLQYVHRSSEDTDPEGHEESENSVINAIRVLNSMCDAADKASEDRDMFEWMNICGLGYRMVEAVDEEERGEDGAPFALHTLDPRQTYVIYSASYSQKPIAAVWIGQDPYTLEEVYNVYTPDAYYVKGGGVAGGWVKKDNELGISIFEYELNSARMGVFEPALGILDAINTVESNRIDGVEQAVQALLVFDNVNIDAEGFDAMREKGALKTRSVEGCSGKVYSVSTELDQNSTQTTKSALYGAFCNIVGMPDTSGPSASADTGTAVLLRDGWTQAETHAKSYELKWKKAEKRVLATILEICRVQSDEDVDISVRDVDLCFSRRNYENTLSKAQVLTTMLAEDRIDPSLAFAVCGLFTDPNAAYLQSIAHYEKVRDEKERTAVGIASAQEQSRLERSEEAAEEYNSTVQKVSRANQMAQETGFHQ